MKLFSSTFAGSNKKKFKFSFENCHTKEKVEKKKKRFETVTVSWFFLKDLK